MIPLLAVLVAVALPQPIAQRYRVEIGGEHVGVASLRITCDAVRCEAHWDSELRAPAESGGGRVERHIEIAASREGFAHHVRVMLRDSGGERVLESHAGPVPASLAETLLGMLAQGEHRCISVRDEASGKKGDACAQREGDWIQGAVLDEPFRARVQPGSAPDEVLVPGQRVRYVADARASLPESAPRLFGSQVRIDDAARPSLEAALAGAHPRMRFCGVPADPRPLAEKDLAVPRDWPEGANCREKTKRYLTTARAAGLDGRHVVGVAWDGTAFAWHEWAEVHVGGRWVPVDPSFKQAPAEPPRFSLARFAESDEDARLDAGKRILSCWGTARIQPVGTPAAPARRP